MNSTKVEKLTEVAVAVFRLNGLLIAWGNEFCLPYGLTSARWQVLGAIVMAPQAPNVPQIAEAMGMTRQGVQKQIDVLVEEGMLLPKPNPAHLRSPLYVLTEKGRKTYQTLIQRWEQHLKEQASKFSAADLEATLRVLSLLAHIHAPSEL